MAHAIPSITQFEVFLGWFIAEVATEESPTIKIFLIVECASWISMSAAFASPSFSLVLGAKQVVTNFRDPSRFLMLL